MHIAGAMTDEDIARATQELYQEERRLDTSYTPDEEADAQEEDEVNEQESASHNLEEQEEEKKQVALAQPDNNFDNKGGNDFDIDRLCASTAEDDKGCQLIVE